MNITSGQRVTSTHSGFTGTVIRTTRGTWSFSPGGSWIKWDNVKQEEWHPNTTLVAV